MFKNTYKGTYRVKNPSKYRGDINNIVYRSSWELKFMRWCDVTATVIEWGSEIAVIPYISPVDKKLHRYFVDFYIKVKTKDGDTHKYLVEIKPERFTKPPEQTSKKTKKFIEEVFLYGTNSAKWEAAEKFCKERNMRFIVLTEKDLGIT